MHLIRSIALFTIVASLGSTSIASSGFPQLIQRSPIDSLFARQTSNPCVPICQPAENAVKSCKTLQCLCTASNAASLQSCITCVITNVSNSAGVISEAQKTASMFNTGCAKFTGIPSLTVPISPAPSTSPAHRSTQSSLSVTTSRGSTIPASTTIFSQAPSTPTTTVAVSTGLPVPGKSITSTRTANATRSTVGSSTSVVGSSTSVAGSSTSTDSSTSADTSPTSFLPVSASAIRNEMVLHRIEALFGLVLGIMLVV